MKKLFVLSLVIVACGEIRQRREAPSCKYKSQWNQTRCDVSMFQDQVTKNVYAQPGEVIKVMTRKDPGQALSDEGGCFVLHRGGVFSKNVDSKPTTCGFQILEDGQIGPAGVLVPDGIISLK